MAFKIYVSFTFSASGYFSSNSVYIISCYGLFDALSRIINSSFFSLLSFKIIIFLIIIIYWIIMLGMKEKWNKDSFSLQIYFMILCIECWLQKIGLKKMYFYFYKNDVVENLTNLYVEINKLYKEENAFGAMFEF